MLYDTEMNADQVWSIKNHDKPHSSENKYAGCYSGHNARKTGCKLQNKEEVIFRLKPVCLWYSVSA